MGISGLCRWFEIEEIIHLEMFLTSSFEKSMGPPEEEFGNEACLHLRGWVEMVLLVHLIDRTIGSLLLH